MEQLFVYGTLKKASIQKEVLGKEIKGSPDILDNYTQSKVKIESKTHPIIIKKQSKYIKGLVLLVNKKELELIDKYETSVYRRRKVILKSKKIVWVYIK